MLTQGIPSIAAAVSVLCGALSGQRKWHGHCVAVAKVVMSTAWLASSPTAFAACGSSSDPRIHLKALDVGVWWVQGERGDSNANNRGHVFNQLLATDPSDSRRLWLVGAGATPVLARALACRVQLELKGRVVTDVVLPWAKAEATLGASAWPEATLWSHEEVWNNMKERCPTCQARMQARLGASATDLSVPDGMALARLADQRVQGDEGTLGPFTWRRVDRGASTAVLALSVPFKRKGQIRVLVTAHGLAWNGATPDLRDSDIASMRAATTAFTQWTQSRFKRANVWVMGEQGPLQPWSQALLEPMHYWHALDHAVRASQQRGDDQLNVPRRWPRGSPQQDTLATPTVAPSTRWLKNPQHELNWQRAWRQAESKTP